MEELMIGRRYCRFNNKKAKQKFKMDDDGAANFKVRRLIKDIDEYVGKTKKRKARKEAKIKENCISALSNKGFYKNAVLSNPGVKALCSGSINARLKGDLFALSNKNNSNEKEPITKISENNIHNPREVCTAENIETDNNSVDSKSLKSPLNVYNEINEDMAELDTVVIENHNLGEIIETISNENNNTSNKREHKVIQEKNENCGLFFKNGSPNMVEIPTKFQELNVTKNENCKSNFDIEPTIKMDEFFDLLHKTPEKKKASDCHLFNIPQDFCLNVEELSLHERKRNSKVGSPLDCEFQALSAPEEYIFKFHSPNNEFFNNGNMFNENKQQTLHDIKANDLNLSPEKFSRATSPKMFTQVPKKSFSSNYSKKLNLKNTKNMFLNPSEDFLSKDIPRYKSERFISLSPAKRSFFINMNESRKTSAPFKWCSRKFSIGDNELNREWRIKKHFYYHQRFKDQYRKEIKQKNDLFKRKCSMLRTTICFKNNFKFSPHKYC